MADESERLRRLKEQTGFSSRELALLMQVQTRVIRALLSGKTEKLRRNEDGSFLSFDKWLKLLSASTDYARPGEYEKRPIRRDGRAIIYGMRKVETGGLRALPIK